MFVKGLEFYAYHGVPDEEQVIGHRYLVNLELSVDGVADESDDVRETVDYGLLCTALTALGQREQFRTVERLARVMGEHVLNQFRQVLDLEIEVIKLLPPAPVILAEAGVRLKLHRPG